ncbi:Flp pilus assembly protein CpaB [Halobacillus fulvus]|nr:Flp pilus assembly protein CpaB [Halobacillus fulvus]
MKTKRLWVWSVLFAFLATGVLFLYLSSAMQPEETTASVDPPEAPEETEPVEEEEAFTGNELLEYENGNRAMTIAVSNEQGVAGFIEADDRVDVVAKMKAPDNAEGDQHDAGTILLQNVRILAVGHAADGQEEMSRYAMVTVEVSPEDGLKLGFATNYELYLMLRNEGDDGTLQNNLHIHEDALHEGVFK